mgnify:CR=1 FL=1
MGVPRVSWSRISVSRGFAEAWGGRVRTDRAVFQVFDPFVQRGECHFVELVYTDQDIFGEDFSGKMRDDHITFTRVDTQMVTRMYTDEMIFGRDRYSLSPIPISK